MGNDDAKLWLSSHHDVLATAGNSQGEWNKQEWTQPAQQTTQCSTVETSELCLVAERLRVCAECLLKQLAIATLHRTWKQCSSWRTSMMSKCDGYPIVHKNRCNSLYFFFFFVGIADDWHRPAICATVMFLQVRSLFYTHPHSFPPTSVVYHLAI